MTCGSGRALAGVKETDFEMANGFGLFEPMQQADEFARVDAGLKHDLIAGHGALHRDERVVDGFEAF